MRNGSMLRPAPRHLRGSGRSAALTSPATSNYTNANRFALVIASLWRWRAAGRAAGGRN
jgi:hypothetical protein